MEQLQGIVIKQTYTFEISIKWQTATTQQEAQWSDLAAQNARLHAAKLVKANYKTFKW